MIDSCELCSFACLSPHRASYSLVHSRSGNSSEERHSLVPLLGGGFRGSAMPTRSCLRFGAPLFLRPPQIACSRIPCTKCSPRRAFSQVSSSERLCCGVASRRVGGMEPQLHVRSAPAQFRLAIVLSVLLSHALLGREGCLSRARGSCRRNVARGSPLEHSVLALAKGRSRSVADRGVEVRP